MEMDEMVKELNIRTEFVTTRDGEGNFISGTVQIYTDKPKELIKTALEKQMTIPIVNCSRDGTGCPTPIDEIQIHNHHVPVFKKEGELLEYTKRIIMDIANKANDFGLQIKHETGEPKTLLETYSPKEEALAEQAMVEDAIQKLEDDMEANPTEETDNDDLPW